MSRQQAVKDKLQDRLEELKTLRDTIRGDLRAASLELKSEWKNLEGKLPDAAATVGQVREVTSETLERLAAELRTFRSRLRTGASAPEVAQVMTRTVATCSPGDTLARAVTLMWDRDVGWLPVVGDQANLLGVITDRDAAVAAATRGQRMDEIGVATVMSTNVVTCTLDASVKEALGLMRSRRVRRLAVVAAGGTLAGVLTLNDLARAVARRTEGALPTAEELVETLAAITAPAEPKADAAPATN